MSERVVLYSTLVTSERSRLPTQCKNSMLRRSPVKRDPYTTTALPRSSGLSNLGQSAGSYSRSASCTNTRSPVTCSRPLRTAAPFPRFSSWVTTRTVLSASWVSTSLVPSVLPSSTNTISRSTGNSTARMRRTISTTVLRSSNTGTITESFPYSALLDPASDPCSKPRSGLATVPPVPVEGVGETLAKADRRTPVEDLLGERDIRSSLPGIVVGQWLEHQLRAASDDLVHELGELVHRELLGVSDVHGPDVLGVEQREQPAYLVVDVAERSGLGAGPVDGDRVAAHRLREEVRHDPAVPGPQPRSVRVEDARNLGVEPMQAVIGHGEGFRVALGLVVHRTGPDAVDVAPVGLRLRVHERVAVDLAGGRKKKPGVMLVREIERVACADRTDLERGDGMSEVLRRAGGTGEVQHEVDGLGSNDVIDDIGDAIDHVTFDEHEAGISLEVREILAVPRQQIIDRNHCEIARTQSAAEVRTEEAGAAGNHRARHQRPTPWYANPRRLIAAGSSRLRASTSARGEVIVSATRAKSSHRNSSHSVRSARSDAPATA